MLAFSRQQIVQPVVVNLTSLVAGLEDMLRRLIGEDIDLVVAPAKDLGSVMADPVQLEQVVMNLVINARDAMPTGGTLTIETRNVDVDKTLDLDRPEAALHPSLQPGPYVMLVISDTGAGMDEATRASIFEPFFTTKGIGKGTGLGLSTVYGIVKQSGGTIWVSTEIGKGSAFAIYLPRTEEVARKSHPASTASPGHRGTETILIAEDEEGVRRLTTLILQMSGYTVLSASSGAQALGLLERHDGPVDLIITDMVMPGMTGRDLVTRLMEIRPRTRVLYTSGYTDDFLLRQGLSDSETHFIAKPYSAAQLRLKVREVLDS